MNTEVIDSYEGGDFESYDEGLDSADDVGVTNAEATEDEKLEAIVDLIGGDSEKADALTGSGDNARRKDFSSRSLNADGRPTYDSHETGADRDGNSKPTSPYGYDPMSHHGDAIREKQAQAQQQWDMAHKANEDIERALRDGDITQEEAYAAQHQAGMLAGQARTAMLEGQLAEKDYEQFRRVAYDHIAKELELPAGDDKALNEEMKATVEWLKSMNVSDSDLTSVDDPAIVIAAGKARRAMERDAQQRGQIIQQKKQIRALKKKLGIADNKAEKSHTMGQRYGTDHQIDQVVELLNSTGVTKNGGRR